MSVPTLDLPEYAIVARRVFTGTTMLTDQTVVIKGGQIVGIGAAPPTGIKVLRLPENRVLSPGFVDLQVNGGGGVLFNDAMDGAGLARILAAHRRAGTTSILPTVISGSRAQLRTAMAVVGDALRAGIAGIAGLHLEGPFLNPDRRGIHPAASIAVWSKDDPDLLCGPFPGPLLVTLAPELLPAGAIARLTASGRIIFAGHSAATFAQIRAALAEGLAGFTHLFNAMSQLTAREPGMVGAALADPRAPPGTIRVGIIRAGIILDGRHVHPAAARLALATMGPERLFLVSDAMATTGSEVTEFDFDGRRIRLIEGRLTDDAGTLAGAHLTMADAVRNAVRLLECDLATALRMATATPSACLGLDQRIGHICPGYPADLVALDADLRVADIWLNGERVDQSSTE